MGAAEKTYSFVEYLVLEAETGQKYEYYDGFLVAMAGGTLVHAQIGVNVSAILSNALRRKDCIALSSDARVAIEEANTYVYPDVAVACPPFDTVQGQAIANPTVVVEVISETSERYDRGEKFRLYRMLPSLKHYLLVSQTEMYVEMYSRNAAGVWTLSEAVGNEGRLYLDAIETELSLEDIYWKVVFEKREGEAKA